MYPFSNVAIMMVSRSSYFRNCISIIFEQDNLDSIVIFFIINHHIIQNVSFLISKHSEAGIPHNYNLRASAKCIMIAKKAQSVYIKNYSDIYKTVNRALLRFYYIYLWYLASIIFP